MIDQPAVTDRLGTPEPRTLGEVHAQMIGAIAAQGGLQGVADIAARELGGQVAVICPPHAVAVLAPAAADRVLPALELYADQLLARQPVSLPNGLSAQRLVYAGRSEIGVILHVGAQVDGAGPVLDAAALASTAALALDAAPPSRRTSGETLVRDLAGARVRPSEVAGRAIDAGLDLAAGAIALAARPRGGAAGSATRARAVIEQESPSAAVAAQGRDILAVIPGGEQPAALRLAAALEGIGAVALAPRERDVTRLGRALREARIHLILVTHDAVPPGPARAGPHRLLVRLAAEDVGAITTLVDETVRPIAEHDARRGADLVATLRAYLDAGARVSVAAASVPAHRHTIAYRLRRVRELTGLGPSEPQDRERLALGLQALAVERAAAELPSPGHYQI